MINWTNVGSFVAEAAAVLVAIAALIVALCSNSNAKKASVAAVKANVLAEAANAVNRDIESGQFGKRETLRSELRQIKDNVARQIRVLEYETRGLDGEEPPGSPEAVAHIVDRIRGEMPDVERVREIVSSINNQSITDATTVALDAVSHLLYCVDQARDTSESLSGKYYASDTSVRDKIVGRFYEQRRKAFDNHGGAAQMIGKAIVEIDKADRGES